MKITKIACSYDRKFNLGDYSSLRLEASIWAELEADDNPYDCMRAIQAQCRESVRVEHGRIKSQVKPGEQVTAKSQLAGERETLEI